ncbi:MAG: NnrS family protein, partial [Gammaproteobacteria bacterium]|nr:NnrS family protein [Gammaproteobacteria bacterium]
MLNIDEPKSDQKIALFNSGFRVFFLAAGLFGVISMLIWMLIYSLNSGPELYSLSTLNWHAHEMIYGYGIAVISGFLLTATTNWTNRKTLTGLSLFVISLFWLLARVSPFMPFYQNMAMMFLFETLFFVMLIVGIGRPIIQSRQWQQIPVILPVIFLLITNSIFYAGQWHYISNGIHIGLYGG